jgi:ZIP family zinc transporter
MGGGKRKSAEGEQKGGSGRSIVLGTVLDGIPEQAVLGMSIAIEGMVSIALLAGIWVSNLPEALGASSGLKKSGWSGSKILLLWSGIVVVSVVAAVLGYLIVDNVSGATGAFVSAFAGGALLAMITSTMAPEAFKKSGRLVGLATTLGFILAVGLTGLEI